MNLGLVWVYVTLLPLPRWTRLSGRPESLSDFSLVGLSDNYASLRLVHLSPCI